MEQAKEQIRFRIVSLHWIKKNIIKYQNASENCKTKTKINWPPKHVYSVNELDCSAIFWSRQTFFPSFHSNLFLFNCDIVIYVLQFYNVAKCWVYWEYKNCFFTCHRFFFRGVGDIHRYIIRTCLWMSLLSECFFLSFVFISPCHGNLFSFCSTSLYSI